MGFRGKKAQTWQNLPDLPHTDARAPPINTVRHRSQHDVSIRKINMFDDKTNDGHELCCASRDIQSIGAVYNEC